MDLVSQIIDDIIYKIANATGKQVSESGIAERAIYSDLLDTRIYLYQQRRKSKQFTDFDIQTIPCVELQQASYSECAYVPKGGKLVLKTIFPVPKPLMGKFEFVTTLLGNIDIDFIAWEKVVNYQGGRFNFDDLMLYTYQNIGNKVHLYLLNTIQDRAVTIKLLAEDPIEVLRYPQCGMKAENICLSTLDQEFPIDKDLLKVCKEMIISNYLDPRKRQSRPDIFQDDNDNTVVPKPNNK